MSLKAVLRVIKIAKLGLLGYGAYKLITHKPWYSFQDRVVLITGGSRGLGLVLARQLVAQGAQVALLARDADELTRAAEDLRARGASVLCIAGDVSDPKVAAEAVEKTMEHYGQLDILVNNAGIIQTGPFNHMDVKDFEEAMKVHFWGPLHTTLAALPYLKRQTESRIINIASIGGKLAVPHLLPYCASKFALVGLSNGLHSELARHGVRVLTVCPGLMRTGSHLHAQFKGKQEQEYFWFALSDSLPLVSTPGDSAAQDILEACRRGDAELVIGAPYRLAARLAPLLPELSAAGMKLFNRLMPGPSDKSGDKAQPGWASDALTPPAFTRLADEAAWENNEVLRSDLPRQN